MDLVDFMNRLNVSVIDKDGVSHDCEWDLEAIKDKTGVEIQKKEVK